MKVRVWGARGSIPAPISPQAIREKMIKVLQGAIEVDLSDAQAIRDYLDSLPPIIAGTAGGNTPCIEVRVDGHLIVIDAGSGLRELGNELMQGPFGRGEGTMHLLFSHLHWDHIQGLPFFTPAYIPGNKIIVYGVHDVEKALMNQMASPTFPVSFDFMRENVQFEFRRLKEGEQIQIKGVKISNIKLPHPGDAYAFRFEHNEAVMVYASDAEYKKLDDASIKPFIRFYSGADVLFFDAQFSLRESLIREDWGHSSALIGADMARRAGVKKLVLFHHDPMTSDEDLLEILRQTVDYQRTTEEEPFSEIVIGREGLTFELDPIRAFSLRWEEQKESAVLAISKDFEQNHVSEVLRQVGQTYETATDSGGARLPRMVVDLTDTGQLNIAGLRALIDLRRHWEGRPMALTGLSPGNYKVIELANCLDLFAIYPNVKAALSSLRAGDTLRLKGELLENRYLIEELLSESDLSTVFKAMDTRLDRPVAIKMFSPTLGQNAIRRMLNKARQVARIQAPNIVTIYDWAEDQGLAYLVMEYIEGRSLRELISTGANFRPLDLAVDILYALEYAHSKGAINGNLKPENVMIAGELKLIDFGLWWAEEGQRLTDLPFLLDDAYYLAPEQIEGGELDERTDLYALGLILYEMFTGRKPFLGEVRYVLEKHLYQRPIPPRQINSNISRSLEHLILKLLAKDPDERYETAAQVRRILLGLEAMTDSRPGVRDVSYRQVGDKESALHRTPGTGRRHTLIGREEQSQQLLRLWDLAQIGRGQMVMVTGEAGVGKTFLVNQLASQVEGASVLVGQGSDIEGGMPYQPFIDVIREYLSQTPASVALEHLGNEASVLATIVPQIRQLNADLPEVPRLEPEQERSRLMRSFAEFVKRASADKPWLLIIENLHLVDPASMQMLFYLFRNISNSAVLIVGVYRDVELDNDHPLRKLDQELSRYPSYHQITLTRLNKEGVIQLLEGIWDCEVPVEWAEAIYKRTGGNPFYIKEVVKGLTEDGTVVFKDGKWHFRPIGDVKLPKSVRDVIMRRVSRFSEPTQEIIRRASVLGQQFTISDLLAISESSEEQLLNSLDEALERDLIREVERGSMLAFSHADIHQVIYEELSVPRRRALHRHIGLVLESRHADNLEPVAGQLAHHFIQAGDREKGLVYSLKAAQHAKDIHAYQSALRWYRQVERLLPTGQPSSPYHMEMYEGLGAILRLQARYADASKAYNALYSAAEASNDLVAQCRALCGLARVQGDLGDYTAAIELANRAVKTAQSTGDQNEEVKALVVLGWIEYNRGDVKAAKQVAEQALELSNTLDARMEIAQSLNLMGVVQDALGNYGRAINYFQSALDMYKSLDNRNQVGYMLNNLGESARMRGDYQKAIRYYQDALSIAREIGDRDGEITYLSNLGAARVGLGQYKAAENDLRMVIQALEATGWGGLAETYCYLAEACLRQNNLDDALAAAEKALALGRERERMEHVGAAWRVLGLIAASTSAPIVIGERRYTGRLRGGDTGKLIRSHYTGELRKYLPDDCFSRSLKIFTDLRMKREQARTLRAWAEYELSKGRKEQAHKHWTKARQIFSDLGLEKELERMDDAIFESWPAFN